MTLNEKEMKMMISDYDRRNLAEKLRETCDEIENEGNGLTVWELADILNIRASPIDHIRGSIRSTKINCIALSDI